MCLSQRWSLLHRSLNELQTPAILQREIGESLSKTHSKAKSGRSNTDISLFSSVFWGFELELLFLRAIFLGNWGKVLKKLLFIRWDIGKKEKSFQKKIESNLISFAHGGSGSRGMVLERTTKEKQEIKNKSIRKDCLFSFPPLQYPVFLQKPNCRKEKQSWNWIPFLLLLYSNGGFLLVEKKPTKPHSGLPSLKSGREEKEIYIFKLLKGKNRKKSS